MMNRILTAAAIAALASGLFSGAAFAGADGQWTARANRLIHGNHFAPRQSARPPIKRAAPELRAFSLPAQTNAAAERAHMRPGRNYDNPTAFRFGDGSRPNRYIWGSSRKYSEQAKLY